MAFMMYGTHLYREVHTTRDLSNLIQQGMGSYLQIPPNEGKSSSRAAKTSTKTTFTLESKSEQGTSSEQQEVDEDLCEKDTREDRNK